MVDVAPLFEYQSLIWTETLLRLAGRPPEELVVHVLDDVRPDHVARLRARGVTVVTVARFDPRLPFANKLRQLESEALADADLVVLCDCDLAFRGDPSALLPLEGLGAKIVDGGYPAYNVWVRLAELAGLRHDRLRLARATQSLRWTYANNLNGGFLTVPPALLAPLAEAWPRWLQWVLEHAGGFGPKVGFHAFQVSLGLVIAELGLPVTVLPDQLNFSTMPPHADRGGPDPLVLHYHRRLTPAGALQRTGVAATDRSVAAVNALLADPETRDLLAPARGRWSADPARQVASGGTGQVRADQSRDQG